MLAAYARKINKLEGRIKEEHEKAEKAGRHKLPASVYAAQDEVAALREQAAGLTIRSNAEAILALRLATDGHECAGARLIRRVMAYLAEQ